VAKAVDLRYVSTLIACLLGGAAGFGAVRVVAAQQNPPSEHDVQAAYLYNFGRFVEWPAGAIPQDRFAVCVLGADPFGKTLDGVLDGLSIGGRRVVARRMATSDAASGCQILFISASEEKQLYATLESLKSRSILTVSDIPQFAQRGGMIQFVTVANRVRFEINLARAQQAGLAIRSDLLKVALVVRKDSRPGE
jgi:hypothetical protein